tara:strand:- start:47 stop:430 length:384 start_codon:yes stop_codon:yes gene_type:complete
MSWQDILKQNLQPFIDSVLAPKFKRLQKIVRVIVITDQQKYSQQKRGGQYVTIELQEGSPEAQQLQSLTNRPVEVGTFARDMQQPQKVTGKKGREFPENGFKVYIFELEMPRRPQEPQQITQYVRRG